MLGPIEARETRPPRLRVVACELSSGACREGKPVQGDAQVTREARHQPRFDRGVSRYKRENATLVAIKADVQAWLTKNPTLRRAAIPLYRRAQHGVGRMARKAARVPSDSLLDVDRILWLPPAEIRFKTLAPGSAFRNLGCGWVLDGDWDVFEHPFVNDMRYRTMRDVIRDGLPWAATEEYVLAASSIAEGAPFQHCRTIAELDARCAALDRVIDSLRADGYLTQDEIRRRGHAVGLGRDDEVTVAVGRDGDFFFRDGAHRLAMAQLLGLERIAVRVTIRHPAWMEVRERVATVARRGRGTVPQPILHPDLDNVPSRQRCDERWRAVQRAVPSSASVVDLAPGWGYFCRRLTSAGRRCAAVAIPAGERSILERLGRAGRDYAVIPADSQRMVDGDGASFEIGLLLDDGLPGPRSAALPALLAILATAKPRELLVEPAAFATDGGGGVGHERNFVAVVAALNEAGGYTETRTLLGESEAGPLLRLS